MPELDLTHLQHWLEERFSNLERCMDQRFTHIERRLLTMDGVLNEIYIQQVTPEVKRR